MGVHGNFGFTHHLHKFELVERSVYVPRKNVNAPVPEWKRELREYLPECDPSRNK